MVWWSVRICGLLPNSGLFLFWHYQWYCCMLYALLTELGLHLVLNSPSKILSWSTGVLIMLLKMFQWHWIELCETCSLIILIYTLYVLLVIASIQFLFRNLVKKFLHSFTRSIYPISTRNLVKRAFSLIYLVQSLESNWYKIA